MLINFHYFLQFFPKKINNIFCILLIIFIFVFRVSESVNLMENEENGGGNGGCRWRNIDVLFVSDSTENIGEENHRILMNFFVSVLKKLGKDDETIHIAMAQFTPEAKYEFSFDSLNARILQSIKNVPYTPCRRDDCRSRATSINGIAATALSADKGNRIISPDILIVVSTSLYQIPELNSGELLIKPASITHAFLITVGNFAPSNGAKVRLQFAATTSQLGAINFEALSELISPLCHSVASFLLVVMAEFPSIFGQNNKSLSGQPADLTWWNYLKWDVPTCTRTNEKNTVFWTVACDTDTSNAAAGTITTSTFVLILACVIVTALIFFLIFGCAVYRYRSETFRLQSKLKKEQQNFQKVDEYYRSKLREKSAQEKEREKAMVELINESNKIRDHYREQATQHQHEMEQQTARAEKAEKAERNPPQNNQNNNNQSSQLPQLIPIPSQYYLPFPTFPPGQIPNLQYPNNDHHHGRGDYDGDVTNRHPNDRNHGSPRNPGEITRGEENRPNNERPNRDQIPPLRRSSSSDYERDEFATDTTDSKEFAFDRTQSHLASDHPARTLPPVDVLLLVDASSSIGNNQFEQVKIFLKDFINDIDIAPGRSRLCVILFAAEPQVFFGFDRFYSIKSIRRAIGKMPYLGGSTFLAKALSFAAGVLYQEQNMKSGRFRKHKFMPTIRHDRLQVMIVVSDGASDDNFDKQATHLHEKMLVKIAAVVTKSFNKDRLLPITRFDGSVFLLDQQQALSIWLWRQQRMWTENFAEYVEREKTLTNLMESSRHPQQQQPESPKKKKKKQQQPKPETTKRTN